MTDLSKTCIINAAIGKWHPQGQVRLRASLEKTGYKGAMNFYTNAYPLNCPTHEQSPYAFKPYLFKEAFEMGYETVIWMDSAVWANKDITPIIEHIQKHGYYFPRNGWTTGEWANDASLRFFNLTRDEAMTYPHMMACVMGLDFRKEIAGTFYNHWFNSIPSFTGAWTNENKQCSQDSRCLGHRHDQTAASIIAHRLGMEFTPTPGYISYNMADTDCILLSQGM